MQTIQNVQHETDKSDNSPIVIIINKKITTNKRMSVVLNRIFISEAERRTLVKFTFDAIILVAGETYS